MSAVEQMKQSLDILEKSWEALIEVASKQAAQARERATDPAMSEKDCAFFLRRAEAADARVNLYRADREERQAAVADLQKSLKS